MPDVIQPSQPLNRGGIVFPILCVRSSGSVRPIKLAKCVQPVRGSIWVSVLRHWAILPYCWRVHWRAAPYFRWGTLWETILCFGDSPYRCCWRYYLPHTIPSQKPGTRRSLSLTEVLFSEQMGYIQQKIIEHVKPVFPYLPSPPGTSEANLWLCFHNDVELWGLHGDVKAFPWCWSWF